MKHEQKTQIRLACGSHKSLGITQGLDEIFETSNFHHYNFQHLLAESTQNERHLFYGDQHIFTMATPEGWIDDKGAASKIGHTHPIFNQLIF